MDWGKVVLLTSGIGIQQKSPLSFGWFNQLVSCQFLFVPFNSDHNRNEDQMLFAGWMIWCLDEEVLKKLISLCWHQFDWRARGWLCRLWRPPCHCWPLSSRSKHSSLRALSPQSVSPCPDLTHRDHSSSHAQICLKFTETNIIQMRTEKVSFTESVKTEQIFKIFNIVAFSLWETFSQARVSSRTGEGRKYKAEQ